MPKSAAAPPDVILFHKAKAAMPPTAFLAFFTIFTLAGSSLGTPAMAHQGLPNSSARLACSEQSLGDSCEWRDSHHALYLGSCRNVASSLLCVRNKPIVYPETHNEDGHSTKQ